MTISNHQADNDRIAQQPDRASAPAHDADQPVGAPTEQVYADRDPQSVGERGLDTSRTAPATAAGSASAAAPVASSFDDGGGSAPRSEGHATAADSLNGTVGSERNATSERHATDSAIGAEGAAAAGSPTNGDRAVPESLFDDLTGLRSRWNDVQAAFVDDPRDCVQRADGLVSDVVDQLTAKFSQARSRLEEQWDRGEKASTEDLRLTLQGYRQFFERLLSV